jgi:3-methylfumaryl-CoA hydratase
MSNDFREWIGRKTEREDVISARTVAEFEATLAPYLFNTGVAPLGIHWCLAPDMVTADLLGGDGHPRLGKFLPDVGLPRRMWAGGEIRLLGGFKTGDVVHKKSVIVDLSFKEGKAGKLCFVTVNHSYAVGQAVIVEERQDIVYRAATGPTALLAAPAVVEPAQDAWIVKPTSTMLFRYSAMTFNGHRIHYDEPYARNVEGYGGLVVHGPLQATLMLNLAARILGRPPRTFSYRGVSPLVLPDSISIDATNTVGNLSLRAISSASVVTMIGQVAGN